MGRRDDEPVFVAEFGTRDAAEAAWERLLDAGLAGAVISDDPPWGNPTHRIQVARADAAAALRALGDD